MPKELFETKKKQISFFFLGVIFTLAIIKLSPHIADAADYFFGKDSDGTFIIKEVGGDVKFRLDPTGAVDIAGQFGSSIVSLGNKTGAVTINWNQGSTQHMVMTGNVTLTFSNAVSGRKYILIAKQDATGGRTITWPDTVRWASGQSPTITSTASKTTYLGFLYNSVDTKYDGVALRVNF